MRETLHCSGQLKRGNGKPRVELEWSNYKTLSARGEIAVPPPLSCTVQQNTSGWCKLLFSAGVFPLYLASINLFCSFFKAIINSQ